MTPDKLENWSWILETGRLTWKRSLQASNDDLYCHLIRPEVGELAFEITNPTIGLGFILSIDYNDGDTKYIILNPCTEKIINCTNCRFVRCSDWNQRVYNLYEYPKLKALVK